MVHIRVAGFLNVLQKNSCKPTNALPRKTDKNPHHE